MQIKENLCTGCGQCVVVCPVQAIKLENNKAIINQDLCVECSVCYRNANCPTKAIKSRRLKWPRIIRNPFSDVIATHRITGIPGRGTEEMKTNDVTNRYDFNEVGISIELGRPGVGSSLLNINLFTKEFAKLGIHYEEESPLTSILNEDRTSIKEDLINERVLSAIIEFKVPIDKFQKVLQIIKKVEKKIDTVFSVGVVSRVKKNGTIPILDELKEMDFSVKPNAKINIGLGRA